MMLRRAWLLGCVFPACSFDTGGQPTSAGIEDATSSSSTSSDSGSAGDPSTTPPDASTSAAESLGDLDTSTGLGPAATTEDGSSGVEPAIETCNGVDDDADGAVDEYSRQNGSCGDCTYQVTESGVVQSYCVEPVTWDAALQRCVLLGASLATIHSAADNGEVFQSTSGSMAWIGLTDVAREGAWAWHDGSALDYTGWEAGQPNNLGGAENCAHMRELDGTWNDDECEELHAFVCRAMP